MDWFPSLVAVRGNERLYGWQAWACQQDPEWTIIRSLKRVLQDAGPNTILELADQQVPLIQVLREMAAALRDLLPQEKLEVMLGVPANANTNQRFLTVEAFRSAGCEVMGLLNEPSAASIEFGHKTKINGVILVYDLGGGTFDASLVEVGEKTHRPLATEGIATLGGDDFDEILAELATTERRAPRALAGRALSIAGRMPGSQGSAQSEHPANRGGSGHGAGRLGNRCGSGRRLL